jgi:hypothetical protein
MLTATACIASKSKSGCGGAMAAAVTTDAIIADAIVDGAAEEEGSHDACWHDAIARGHDPEIVCGD